MNTKIAVLIPVYNNLEGLICSLQTITSSLKVTVVIVDDGSDEVIDFDVISQYTQHDIKLIILAENVGIVGALNAGLQYIYDDEYTHIARLDAGDLMTNNRLDTQVQYLSEHKDCVIIGGAARFVDANGELLFNFSPPTSYKHIKKSMHLNNCFCHPTVMWKVNMPSMEKYFYKEEYKYAEDYEMFWNVLKLYRAENLPISVVDTFADPGGISRMKRKEQLTLRMKIQLKNFEYLSYESYVGLLKSSVLFMLPVPIIDRIKTIISVSK